MTKIDNPEIYNRNLLFLNSSARDLYNQFDHNFSPHLVSRFKSQSLISINAILKTIKGVFNNDKVFTNVNYNKLEIMYPTGCQTLKTIIGSNDVTVIGTFFDKLRNMNAHAYISKNDGTFFDYNFSSLKEIVPFNTNIKYYDGELTVAGLVYIILLFLRETTLKRIIRGYDIYKLVLEESDITRFVNEISHINLNVAIRDKTGNSIESSIIGEYESLLKRDGKNISLIIGEEKFPSYLINGSIDDNIIKIKEGSLTKTYYELDYEVRIDYREGFVELANQLPPFVIIDLLKEYGITVFGEKEYNFLINKRTKDTHEWMFAKLNYAKFYVDKNLNILLLDKETTNVPMLTQIFAAGINTVCLFIENKICNPSKWNPEKYSSIKEALTFIDIDQKIVHEMQYVRNFAAHGYIINEVIYYEKEKRKITLNYILSTLIDLLKFIKINRLKLSNILTESVIRYLVNTVIKAIYKPNVDAGINALNSYPNFDSKFISWKNLMIEHTPFDINKFDYFIDCKSGLAICTKILKIKLDGKSDFYLYIFDDEEGRKCLNDFCLKHNHQLIKNPSNHVLINCELK